jgi:hypothetical protein
MSKATGRTRPRYPWREVGVGERFVVAVASRQGAMEQCSRASVRYGRRFVVVAEFRPYGWLVERVPTLNGKFAPPGTKRAALVKPKPSQKRRRDPLQHLYEVLDAPAPWETE